MKLQVCLKNLKKIRRNQSKEIDELITTLTNNYVSDLIKYQEDLLLNICRDNDLNYDDLHSKYIKSFKKNVKKNKNINLIDNSDSDSDIESEDIKSSINVSENNNETNVLEKIIIKDNTCYIENKEGGSIYNNEVIKIGEVREGEYFLYN